MKLVLTGENVEEVLRSTIYQILNCPYQGVSRRMYLESRAIDRGYIRLNFMRKYINKIITAQIAPCRLN